MSRVQLESWEELLAAENAELEGMDPGGEDEMLPDAYGFDGFDDESYRELVLGLDERRPRTRWELDPASAEDFADHARRLAPSRRWRHFGQ